MEVMEMWRALKQVTEEKEAAANGLLFEEASQLFSRENDVKASLRAMGVEVDDMLRDAGGAAVTVAAGLNTSHPKCLRSTPHPDCLRIVYQCIRTHSPCTCEYLSVLVRYEQTLSTGGH
jgi:hypothetical protein